MIEGFSTHQLARYAAMRERFDREAKTLNSLTNLLGLLQHCDADRVAVDLVALGHVNQLMAQSVLRLWEVLDDFLYLPAVQAALRERERQ